MVTTEELLRELWGFRNRRAGREQFESHAHRLRTKLTEAAPDRTLVVNVWGIGYRLCDHVPTRAAA